MHRYAAVWMAAVVATAMVARAQGPARQPVSFSKSTPADSAGVAPGPVRQPVSLSKSTPADSAGVAFGQPVEESLAPASAAVGADGRPLWEKMKVSMAWFLSVQYNGRVMPLDSVARQVVRKVTGQRSYDKHDSTALLLAWVWLWPDWANEPMVLVDDPDLQKYLALPVDQKRFAYDQLEKNAALMQLAMEARRLSRARQPVSPLQRAAAEVWERLSILDTVRQGVSLRIVPAVKDARGTWVTVAEVDKQEGIDPGVQQQIRKGWDRMHAGFLAGDGKAFNGAVKEVHKTLTDLKAAGWPTDDRVALEVLYNLGQPVRAGWVAMFATMAVGLLAAVWPKRWVKWIAWGLLVDGFGLLTLGIYLRWTFSGHAPLATMYESLVFMGWGVTAIGIITMLLVKQRAVLPIVAGIATAILVVADIAPLESAAAPLEPVLRNTMWLTYHVLTVMMAYSAFALAMGVGHVQAASLAVRPRRREWTGQLGRLVYGMTLAGCVLLTTGIIFGAIWASKSWGRYWGWDPKETWSLVTLLVYMILLHGRLFGLVGSFGLAVGSILCFQVVVMTYYGVNFVLGQGLHSYGFSQGGQVWVGGYVLAELAFVMWAWAVYSRTAKAQAAAIAEPVVKP